MKQLIDQPLLERYLRQWHIEALFSTRYLPFQLWQYEAGEIMNLARPTEKYLKFVVEGSFRRYALTADGTYAPGVWRVKAFAVVGDLEFCGVQYDNHFHQALETVRCVELPLEALRPTLMDDNRFLRYLLRLVGKKAANIYFKATTGPGLRQALLDYMRSDCPDQRITNVEETALMLNYSRSQLQRVLRDLTAQGLLKKEGRGTYRLV